MTDLCNPYIFQSFLDGQLALWWTVLILALIVATMHYMEDPPAFIPDPPQDRYREPPRFDNWRW